MAKKQAEKRARQEIKRNFRNKSRLHQMRTQLKKVGKAIEVRNIENSASEFKLATKILDILAAKGIIHKNKASRHKSRLATQINTLSAA